MSFEQLFSRVCAALSLLCSVIPLAFVDLFHVVESAFSCSLSRRVTG